VSPQKRAINGDATGKFHMVHVILDDQRGFD
jgi:hypothetical protein